MPTLTTTSTQAKSYSIDVHDAVHVVSFSPFEWSSQLLAIGTATRVSVGNCRFQEESSEVSGVQFEVIQSFQHASRITSLAWSPETSTAVFPKMLRFCTASADGQIQLFTSDLVESVELDVLGMHTDYANDVCFQPQSGEHVASVGDDHTCRVWSVAGGVAACFPLTAPGTAVRWHADEPGKIMVAEKKGIIRFYNVMSQQPIMSVDCNSSPLMSADWCPTNTLRVAAVAGANWLIFDTSRSSRPIETKQVHSSTGQLIGWCKSHDYLLASLGCTGSQLRVFNVRSNQLCLSKDLPACRGLAWHARLPLIAVGGDKKVHFWLISVI